MGRAAIEYREFWDVPRMFLVAHRGYQLLFDCPFDDEIDEYPESYNVHLMPVLTPDQRDGSWENLPALAIRRLGTIPVADVGFDPTKRESVDYACLDRFMT